MISDKTVEQKMIIDEMSNKIDGILRCHLYDENIVEIRKFITEKCNDVLKDISFADFKVVCDESNNAADVLDKNELNCDVIYRFNKGDEFTFRQYTIHP